jgi:ribosome-binding protein aMBF1 (putative translation factor)
MDPPESGGAECSGGDEYAEIVCEDCEEVRKAQAMRDPGSPTTQEVEEHNITHLPFRGWCPACVAGKARDRPHRKVDHQSDSLPQIVFDYGFIATEGKAPLGVQVM